MGTRKEEILSEIRALENLIQQHDYIGIKIAMGRATAEEYAEQIAESDAWAARISELREELAALEEE